MSRPMAHFWKIASASLVVVLASGQQQDTVGGEVPLEDQVARVGPGVSQPSVLEKHDPEYSQQARTAGVCGTVLLSLIVDIDGKAKRIRVIRGLGYGLDERAIAAVRDWTFAPGAKNGQPVPVYATIQTSFRLLSRCKTGTPEKPKPPRIPKPLITVRLAGESGASIDSAAISPDGQRVAYSSGSGVYVVPFSGGDRRLLPDSRGLSFVRWSSDSAKILLRSTSGEASLKWMTVESGATQRADNADLSSGDSPDGRHHVLVTGKGKVLTVNDSAGKSLGTWDMAGRSTIRQTSWAADGRHLAVLSSSPVESTIHIVEMPEGKIEVAPGVSDLDVESIAWSGSDRLIVAARETIDNKPTTNLWELRKGAAPLRLSYWTGMSMTPLTLNISGQRAIFRHSTRRRQVYIAETAEGHLKGTPQALAFDASDSYPTDWTRDGKAILFTATSNGLQRIYKQDLNGKAPELLVDLRGSQNSARFAPDGQTVLFRLTPLGARSYEVMRIGPTSGKPEPIPDLGQTTNFRCSASGPCIFVTRQSGTLVCSEFDPSKGKTREIYREPAGAGDPDVSPDGKWLAYVLAASEGNKIVVRSTESGEVKREIAVGTATKLLNLDWAADGKGFYSSQSSKTEAQLLHIDESGKVTVLWTEPGTGTFGIWAIPAPDGKHLALAMYSTQSEIYAVENF